LSILIKLFFTTTFSVAIFSCSTIEIDQEKLTEENKNIIDQIAQVAKQNKSNEEEISLLKSQLSEIQKAIEDDSDPVLPNDSERQAYQQAFELIRKGEYQAAEVAFANYAKIYQDSDFIDDAKFWLAQSMYSQGAYNTALELFEGIQKEYPQSEKIMESILKAGFCHFELGNLDKSIQIFKQIIADYPNSSVARLASEKLDTIN
jgi:tol-pal system protein YbgF